MAIASLWLCCLELFSQKLNLSVFQFIFMSNFILLHAEPASKVIAQKARGPRYCFGIPERLLRVCVLLLVQLLCS